MEIRVETLWGGGVETVVIVRQGKNLKDSAVQNFFPSIAKFTLIWSFLGEQVYMKNSYGHPNNGPN